MRKQARLEPRLDVDPEAPLERDDALRVRRGAGAAALVALAPAREEVERVDAQADRDLASAREAFRSAFAGA